MEKDILITELRNRVGVDNASVISDKTFDAFGEMWKPLFADDSKITDDTWKGPLEVLKQYAGQKRHDDAAFATKFKTDYETKAKAELDAKLEEARKAAIEEFKKSQPKPDDNSSDNGDQKLNELIDAKLNALSSDEGALGKLTKALTTFIEESNKRDKATQLTAVKQGLTEYLKGLGASSAPTIEDAIKDIEYGDKLDMEELKPKIKAAYEARFKRYFGDGGKPFGGGGSNDPYPHDDDMNDAIKKKVDALKKELEQQQSYQERLKNNFQ